MAARCTNCSCASRSAPRWRKSSCSEARSPRCSRNGTRGARRLPRPRRCSASGTCCRRSSRSTRTRRASASRRVDRQRATAVAGVVASTAARGRRVQLVAAARAQRARAGARARGAERLDLRGRPPARRVADGSARENAETGLSPRSPRAMVLRRRRTSPPVGRASGRNPRNEATRNVDRARSRQPASGCAVARTRTPAGVSVFFRGGPSSRTSRRARPGV